MENQIPIYTKEQLAGAQQAIEERKKICEELKEIYRLREIERREKVLAKNKITKK